MKVAICIPTYNQAQYLIEAVNSAFSQTYTDIEVWVSNDNSSDNTEEILNELKIKYVDIRIFNQTKNLGMSQNPKWILNQPDCKYLVKLDSDDILLPRYVETFVEFMNLYPEAAYFHTSVNEMNSQGEILKVRKLARKTGLESANESLQKLASGFRVCANICGFRKSALDSVGSLRDGMRFCDDWDLGVRLADANWGNVYVSSILANYRVWDTSDNIRLKRVKDEISGAIFVFNHSLIPAFSKRNWNNDILEKNKQNRALRYSVVLNNKNVFDENEIKEIIVLLRELGDSYRLRLYLLIISSRNGKIIDVYFDIINFLKRTIKSIYY